MIATANRHMASERTRANALTSTNAGAHHTAKAVRVALDGYRGGIDA